MGIDYVTRVGRATSAVVDLDWKGCPIEVGCKREAEVFHQLEEAVDMIVGIDRSKVIRAGVIIKIATSSGRVGAATCRDLFRVNVDQCSLQ